MSKLNMLFLGDFVSQSPGKITIGNSLKSLLKSSDYAICNFEAPIRTNGAKVAKSGPSIAQSVGSPSFLESIGVNIISLSNNHICDYGTIGVSETIASFSSALCIGIGSQEEVYKTSLLKSKNIRVGLLALSHAEYCTFVDDYEDNGLGCAWINSPKVDKLIVDSKAIVDYLVVMPHAGVENMDIPIPEWRRRYKQLIDLGADCVIATHPHVPQGWDFYEGKYIYYSLGNFFFDSASEHKYWNYSIGVSVCIDIDENNLISVTHQQLNIFANNNTIDICHEAHFEEHLCLINSLLVDRAKYDLYLDKEIEKCWNDIYCFYLKYSIGSISLNFGFKNFLRMLLNSILKRSKKLMLLNLLQCESHRYVIIRSLKKYIKK